MSDSDSGDEPASRLDVLDPEDLCEEKVAHFIGLFRECARMAEDFRALAQRPFDELYVELVSHH